MVFVLDEFERFAQRPRQTLLYTLLDFMQANETPIAVIGITSRLDAIELLEKRVKSRFSQGQILFNYFKTVEELLAVFSLVLTIPEKTSRGVSLEYSWNDSVKKLLSDDRFSALITKHFDYYKDIRWFYNLINVALTLVNSNHPYLVCEDFEYSSEVLCADPKAELIKGLSTVEVGLIVSLNRLLEQESPQLSAQHVYQEYKTYSERNAAAAVSWSIAQLAFSHLLQIGLFLSEGNEVNTSYVAPSTLFRLAVDSQVLVETITGMKLPTALVKWGSKWLE